MRLSSTSFVSACLCVRAVVAAPYDIHSAFTNSSNTWDARTTVLFPNSTAFAEATERWNNANRPGYAVAITPATEEDVAKAVCSRVDS